MARKKQSSGKSAKPRRSFPGSAPGSINIPENSLKPILWLHTYKGENHNEVEVPDFKQAWKQINSDQESTYWLDIKGFGDPELFDSLNTEAGIHKLELEDTVNTHQRPKVEEYANHYFMVSRMMYKLEDELNNEQLSMYMGKNWLITLQESYYDILDPVRERVRHGKGRIRNSGPDYLAYALMDAVVDNYYPLLEQLGTELDDLEDALFDAPKRENLQSLQLAKRDLIIMRRAIWPEREKINEILRSKSDLLREDNRVFFRDIYDHSVQVMDLVENYKEMTASLMDIYLSSLSNRMNQIMKVLAIISSIFIPLGFIAGLYGMNFMYENPDGSGENYVMNMPELRSPYGYPIVLGLMATIVIFQLIIFYKKGWLNKD